jgi:thiamine-phosphate pyrophosphorylase
MLAEARLYVLVGGSDTQDVFRRLVEAIASAGVDVLQLRDKHLADRERLARARWLREVTAEAGTLFIMNDRPDLAVLAEADGVHVGQEELTVQDVRMIVGPDLHVGVSTHSLEQAQRAVQDGADYIGVGPVFPSATKRFAHFPGLELLRAVQAEISLPAFAIGGIDADNLAAVLATGVARVAIRGAIAEADDPAAVVRVVRRQLTEIPLCEGTAPPPALKDRSRAI